MRAAIEEERETGAAARKEGLVPNDLADLPSDEFVSVVVIPQGKTESRSFLVVFEQGHVPCGVPAL